MAAYTSVLMFRKDAFFGAFLGLVSVAALVQAYTYADDSSQFPRFLAWMLCLFSLLNLGRIYRMVKASGLLTRNTESERSDRRWLTLSAVSVGGLAVYVFAIDVVGYYVATSVYLMGVMYSFSDRSRASIMASLLATALFIGLAYGLFGLFLGTRLPVGMLLQ